MSPAMIARGLTGTNGPAFAARVDALFGYGEWRRIQEARRRGSITAPQFRDEMVNLLRCQLEDDLGYSIMARIPMRMPSSMPIYDMVFATDHWAGNKIMSHLYRNAARREPQMIQEARARARRDREDKAGTPPMFDLEPTSSVLETIDWESRPAWDPTGEPWW
jgi:hypothetical protein